MIRRGDWIQTYTGVRFYPLDPRPEDIFIDDIAHALSMKCRFNGHTNKFYGVAQHSLLVSLECEKRYPKYPNLWLWGLLHDAAEAYLPDIPRPLKRENIGVLKKAEQLIMKEVAKLFQLAPKTEPYLVKEIDNAILANEAIQLMKQPIDDWYLPTPPLENCNITPTSPEHSKVEFLGRFEGVSPLAIFEVK